MDVMDTYDFQNYGDSDVIEFPFEENVLFSGKAQDQALDYSEHMTVYDDSDINDLVDIMSNSNSSHPENVCDQSLDDIPLTEAAEAGQILQIIPNNVPDNNLLVLKIPELFQDDPMLNEMLDIDLDDTIMDQLSDAMKDNGGVYLKKSEATSDESGIPGLIRRPPLQLIQQVIQYPAVKNYKGDAKAVENKTPSKRKQMFEFPREDRVEFYSDGEDEEVAEKKDVLEDSNISDITMVAPSPKRQKVEKEPVKEKKPRKPVKAVKPEKKKNEDGKNLQKCPVCNKSFKRISLHKCKKSCEPPKLVSSIPKLKPSDVPMPIKCTACRLFFHDESLLEQHVNEKHSRTTCKACKFVSKTINGINAHRRRCGVKIEPVIQLGPSKGSSK